MDRDLLTEMKTLGREASSPLRSTLDIRFLQGILLGTVADRKTHKCLSMRNLQLHGVLVEFPLDTFLIKL